MQIIIARWTDQALNDVSRECRQLGLPFVVTTYSDDTLRFDIDDCSGECINVEGYDWLISEEFT